MARERQVLTATEQFQLASLMRRLYDLRLRGFRHTIPHVRWSKSWDRTGEYLILACGPLVVVGKWEPEHYFVLTNGTEPVEIIPGQFRCQVRARPGSGAEAVPVITTDAGPWWPVLVQEVRHLEMQLDRYSVQMEKESGRLRQLSRAGEAVRQFLQEAV